MTMNHSIRLREKEAKKFIERHGGHLCHYTSIQALQGILSNKEFWFGSTASMNDKSEIKHFINELKESLCIYK